MVPLDFVIRRVVLDDEFSGPTLSLADGFSDEPNYVQLQMASAPDDDDMRLKMDGVYVEANGQGCSGYDFVESIRVDGGVLVMQFSVRGATVLHQPRVCRWPLDADAASLAALRSGVMLFQARITSTATRQLLVARWQ